MLDLADEAATQAHAVMTRAREVRAAARAARREFERLRARIRRRQGLPDQREQQSSRHRASLRGVIDAEGLQDA
jgi:hypothetical protein